MNALNHRRSFLRSIVALPLFGATSAVSVIGHAQAAHPDADLLALGREWQEAAGKADELVDTMWELEDSIVEPEPPEALFRRKSDFGVFAGFSGAPYTRTDDHRGERWYGDRSSIEAVLKQLQFLEVIPDPETDNLSPDARSEMIARCREILDAHADWENAKARAEEEVGLSALRAKRERAGQIEQTLRQRIARAPAAHTLDGAAIKAKAAIWEHSDCLASAEKKLQFALEKDQYVSSETIAMIIACDLLRLQANASEG